jgi:ribosomal protein L40E
MQFFAQYPVQFFRRWIERVRAWRRKGQRRLPFETPFELTLPNSSALIHRDVTPNGVRYYGVCSDCGSRLSASATLCEACAQKRSRPARPF